MLVATFIAAPCFGIVEAKLLADTGDIAFCDIGIRGFNMGIDKGAGIGRSIYGLDEFGATVRINSVISAVIGY